MSAKRERKQDRDFGGAALAERTPRETTRKLVRDLAGELKAAAAAYRGGLPAERQSYAARRKSIRARMRATAFAGRGRRIDLAALLAQKRRDGKPKWALVDPAKEIGYENGCYEWTKDGVRVRVAGPPYYSPALTLPKGTHEGTFQPAGMPALPARVRELAADPRVRKHARWVGVVYQPEEWVQLNPDPALVVEWHDTPGQFYALAVWGGDRAAVMEFVD